MARAVSTGRMTKQRMFKLLLFFMIIPVLLMLRIGFWQLVDGERLEKEAIEQQTRDRTIASKRGMILDRNGKQLAVSASVASVSCTPSEVKKSKKEAEIAASLAGILGMNQDEVLKKITKRSSYEVIKKKIEKDVADEIRKLKLPGIHLDEDAKRYYPYGNFAAQLIGATGADNQGLFGIEAKYDRYLKGVPGRIVTSTDVKGIEMPNSYERYVDPKEGSNIVLGIDEVIQHFAEKHLETAVIDNKAEKGGACIVMDPKTGEILAMAVKPDFDLNKPFTLQNEELQTEIDKLPAEEKNKRYSEELGKMWRNKAIVDSYEPGSVFKIFTSTVAMEENLVSDSSTFNCAGSVTVGGKNIKCWRSYNPHGLQTFAEGVQNSCNPVFIDLGMHMGADIFYKYFKGFGFLEKAGIDFDGETSGIFHQKQNFHDLELATASFGQGFQVTPLQMIDAMAAVANGGKLIKPHIVKQIVDANGNVVENIGTEVRRQVISKETAEKFSLILESVVSKGTAKNAYVKGYRIGGKTGTSEKLPRGQGKYIASFCGFAPVNDPRLVVLVILDEPKGDYYGGVIAAPVVGKIMEDVLGYMGVPSQDDGNDTGTAEVNVPNVVEVEVTQAKKKLTQAKLTVKVVGSGTSVLEQTPKAGIRIAENSQVILYTEENTEKAMVKVPNLVGATVTDSTKMITGSNLNIRVNGSGLAVSQDPPAGTMVAPGTVISVDFRVKSDLQD